jgi:hypothetical protein
MRSLLPYVLVLGLCSACHAPVTITTPQGQTAYKADQVVVRVNELMNTAIQANAGNALPTDTTRTIVEFCVGADKTLAAAPAGWQASVQAAWLATKPKLAGITNPAVVAAMSAVDVVLAVAGGA